MHSDDLLAQICPLNVRISAVAVFVTCLTLRMIIALSLDKDVGS